MASASAATPGRRARAWVTRAPSSTWSRSCASIAAATSCARWAIAWCTAGRSTPRRCGSTAGSSPCWKRWYRSRRCTSLTTWHPSARFWRRAPSCPRWRASTPHSTARSPRLRRRSRCRPRLPSAGCVATAFTGFRTPTSPRCCPRSTRAQPPGAPWSCTSATERACVRSRRAQAWRARWGSRQWTDCPWAHAAVRSTRA